MPYTIVNETFILSDQASLLVGDLAIQRGYGIFDFFKTINNQPIFLDHHLDRLFASAEAMRLTTGLSRSRIKDLLHELIEENNIPDSGVRITVTGGYSPDGFSIGKPNLIITQQPLHVNEALSSQGIKIITYPYSRQLYQAKTLDYVMAIWLRPLVEEKQAQDVLYFNNGLVSECPRANFFIVTREGKILTAANNILKGVIRKNVLQLTGDGIQVCEGDITLNDLKHCTEAFITSTTKNILPVLEIDGRKVGSGKPGEVTLTLSKKLLEAIHTEYLSEKHLPG